MNFKQTIEKIETLLLSDEYMQNHRFFVAEKDVKCNTMYDLSGIADRDDVKYRGYK